MYYINMFLKNIYLFYSIPFPPQTSLDIPPKGHYSCQHGLPFGRHLGDWFWGYRQQPAPINLRS